MNSSEPTVDAITHLSIKACFERAANTYDLCSILQQDVGDVFLQSLQKTTASYEKVLDFFGIRSLPAYPPLERKIREVNAELDATRREIKNAKPSKEQVFRRRSNATATKRQ